MKIKKGDKVIVIAGRDRGRTGEVLRVAPKESRLFVQGVNMVKRHTRQKPGETGGIVEKEGPIHISNVAHVDPKDGKATRVGFKVVDGDRKVRFAKRSGEIIDR
ncbi:MAG: 50S ribosomal protein L24 [Rhodospirillales bacterium]|nr:50S ribosomal protein L24 [Rhodospirillales bacterium]